MLFNLKIFLSLGYLTVLSSCSAENTDLEKRIEELEKDSAYKQSVIDRLYDDLIAKCTSSRENVTTFGPFPLVRISFMIRIGRIILFLTK